LKRQDLIRHLEVHGCRLHREGARHSIYVNPQIKKTSAVPRHGEIKNPLAIRICKDLQVPDPIRG